MSSPWMNVALLIFLPGLLLTGLWGLINGDEAWGWVMGLHDAGGYAVALLLARKGSEIVGAFRRGRRRVSNGSSLAFLGMLGLLLFILITGFGWGHGLGPKRLAGFSTINVHVFLTVGLALLLGWHVLARRFLLGSWEATDRRALLRIGTSALAGLGLWLLARPAQALLNLPGAHRRFTGSYETGSLGGDFPTTRWLLDTHVAGELLSHGHGFPVRLVAPERRGIDWVKWIVRVEVSEEAAIWQSPLPLQ